MTKRSNKYPNPEVECPKCKTAITGTGKVRVRNVGTKVLDPDYRVLDRGYFCFGCGYKFWYEIIAREI